MSILTHALYMAEILRSAWVAAPLGIFGKAESDRVPTTLKKPITLDTHYIPKPTPEEWSLSHNYEILACLQCGFVSDSSVQHPQNNP